MDAASGITHLLASTLVRGQAFHVMRTPSRPSGSVLAISDISLLSKGFRFCGIQVDWKLASAIFVITVEREKQGRPLEK
jgi:hypothetical protein